MDQPAHHFRGVENFIKTLVSMISIPIWPALCELVILSTMGGLSPTLIYITKVKKKSICICNTDSVSTYSVVIDKMKFWWAFTHSTKISNICIMVMEKSISHPQPQLQNYIILYYIPVYRVDILDVLMRVFLTSFKVLFNMSNNVKCDVKFIKVYNGIDFFFLYIKIWIMRKPFSVYIS